MKKFIASTLITASLFLTGCGTSPNLDPTDKNYPLIVEKTKNDTRSGAIASTASYLLIVKPEKRKAVASELHKVATEVKQRLDAGTVEIYDVKALVVMLTAHGDSQDEEMATLMAQAVISLVESNLNINFGHLTVDLRQIVAKDLISSAIEGVLEVTSPFVR